MALETVFLDAEDAAWLEKVHRTKQAQLREFHTEQTLATELERAQFQIARTRRLEVRENITRWMADAISIPGAAWLL